MTEIKVGDRFREASGVIVEVIDLVTNDTGACVVYHHVKPRRSGAFIESLDIFTRCIPGTKAKRFNPVDSAELIESPDQVNHPPHYQGQGIECIDAIAAIGHAEGFCLGNCFKYLWRWQHKGGVEDLKKARFYLDWLINYLERNP